MFKKNLKNKFHLRQHNMFKKSLKIFKMYKNIMHGSRNFRQGGGGGGGGGVGSRPNN